jgi:hypothetical protein
VLRVTFDNMGGWYGAARHLRQYGGMVSLGSTRSCGSPHGTAIWWRSSTCRHGQSIPLRVPSAPFPMRLPRHLAG